MRVLFISRAYPPLVGGIENQNEALGRYLSKTTKCSIIANTAGKAALAYFVPYAATKAILKRHSTDIILLGDGVAAIIGWLIKLFTKKPVVCILHGLDITWNNFIYQTLWVHFFFKKIDHFVTVSHSTREIAIKAGIPAQKITVIPNGVEEPTALPLSKPILAETIQVDLEGKFVLLSLGRLIERKGVAWFIEHVLTKLNGDIVYLIAGDGPEKPKIQQLITQHKLDNKAFLLGPVNNQLKQTLFCHSNLFIQPNIPVDGDVEGFGITQIEAGISGLPSISSKLEGIVDAIHQNKNGWLVTPLNTTEFIKTIEEKQTLLKTQQKAIRSTTKEYCKTTFEWQTIIKQYVGLFNLLTPIHQHRKGFSPTTNRESKARKILKILEEASTNRITDLSILDIGTGNGEISSYIGKTNHVTSVDIIDTRQTHNNFNYAICNELLPFKNESFDIVISNHVIEHVSNQQLHINEIIRSLKTGGTLYLATPNRLWPYEVHYKLYLLHYLPQKLFIGALKWLNKYEEDVDLLTIKNVRTLLKQGNLTSYSGKIIKKPSTYLMNTPKWLEKILHKLPIWLLEKTTFIHPTFIFVYTKP
ncbi:MAG: hypothetical protein COB26_01935 [Piscirickettsiaceae bacterium]|nr:MAG: hypothetical protein COB26_01935 [Piscirickettsiaceae bacterium]